MPDTTHLQQMDMRDAIQRTGPVFAVQVWPASVAMHSSCANKHTKGASSSACHMGNQHKAASLWCLHSSACTRLSRKTSLIDRLFVLGLGVMGSAVFAGQHGPWSSVRL